MSSHSKLTDGMNVDCPLCIKTGDSTVDPLPVHPSDQTSVGSIAVATTFAPSTTLNADLDSTSRIDAPGLSLTSKQSLRSLLTDVFNNSSAADSTTTNNTVEIAIEQNKSWNDCSCDDPISLISSPRCGSCFEIYSDCDVSFSKKSGDEPDDKFNTGPKASETEQLLPSGSAEGHTALQNTFTNLRKPRISRWNRLKNTWVFWFLEKRKKRCIWHNHQREIVSFDAVEDFWSIYSHLREPTEIKNGSAYSLFKEGIPPLFDDDSNSDGGCWVIATAKRGRDIDKYWLATLLSLIGCSFGKYHDNVCGATVKNKRIILWTSKAGNKECNKAIGRRLKERLGIRFTIHYYFNADYKSTEGITEKMCAYVV